MALLMDHGVYYEFLPLDQLDSPRPEALEFREVEVGQTYALVVSTIAGLWRCLIGDLVTVTSTLPLRIQVTGRITSFLNLVGEEVMEQQTDRAIGEVATAMGTEVYNYMVGPVFDEKGKPIGHRWIVEFGQGDNFSLRLMLSRADLMKRCNPSMVIMWPSGPPIWP